VSFANYLNVVEIIISVTLILVILLQARGSGFGSALGGSSSTFYRTRRGAEKTLFQLTIVLVVIFILISAWSVRST